MNQGPVQARLAAFAVIRQARDLRLFLERNRDMLTEDAESELRSMALREIDGPHPEQAVRLYLRYRLFAAARATGIPAAFRKFYGSQDSQVPADLGIVRDFLDDAVHMPDQSDENRVLRIGMLAADAALADPSFPGTPAEFRSSLLARAGGVNHQAFLRGAGIVPLKKAIQYWERVLDADDAPRQDQLEATNNLGTALLYLFEEQEPHEQAVLDRGIALLSQVIGSDGPVQLRATAQVNLASSLRTRYDMAHDTTDLDRAIAMAREVLADPSAGNLSAIVKHNLANGLAERFRIAGDTADRDEAIRLYQEAVAVSAALPEQVATLIPLAGLLTGRFERDGDPADFQATLQIIADGREQLTPGAHDHWYLTRMAAWIHVTRYIRDDDPQDLEAAIDLLEGVADLERLTVDDRRAAQSLLSELLSQRYRISADPVNLVRAAELGIAARRSNLRRRPTTDSGG